jgi:hypothetical protein
MIHVFFSWKDVHMKYNTKMKSPLSTTILNHDKDETESESDKNTNLFQLCCEMYDKNRL